MVLKCHTYNFIQQGSTKVSCQGRFEDCAILQECTDHDPFCFALSIVPTPNSTLTINTAGCFSKHKDANLNCKSDSQCLAEPERIGENYKYFCCCQHDACNGKLLSLNVPHNRTTTTNITTTNTAKSTPDSSPNQSVILLAVLFLIALPALGLLIRRVRNKNKIKKDRNNLIALATRTSHNEDAADIQTQTQIPKYDLKDVEVLDLIGSGRFGTVHKANLIDHGGNGQDCNGQGSNSQDCQDITNTQNSTKTEIAVKIIKNNEYQSFQNELNIYSASSTRHPNILSFLGLCENPQTNSNWLLVEYASNGSLHHYLKENTVTWSEFLRISLGIVRGLSHLHDADVAHRDFKSKNVLLRRNLSPCITDFGVATILDMTGGSQAQQRKNYLQVGTPRYMAPEVLECSVSFTKISFTKIDVYALSLVLWELLSRCFPLPKTKVNDSAEDDCLVQPYRLPFDEFVNSNPDINTMRQVVVCDKRRPPIKDEWKHYPLSRISQAIIDGWEYDHDARISASCFVERIESLETHSTRYLRK